LGARAGSPARCFPYISLLEVWREKWRSEKQSSIVSASHYPYLASDYNIVGSVDLVGADDPAELKLSLRRHHTGQVGSSEGASDCAPDAFPLVGAGEVVKSTVTYSLVGAPVKVRGTTEAEGPTLGSSDGAPDAYQWIVGYTDGDSLFGAPECVVPS